MVHTNRTALWQCCWKKMIADFTGGDVTSDAGLLLLRPYTRQMRLFEAASGAIRDGRRQGSVKHHVIDQLRQQRMGLT